MPRRTLQPQLASASAANPGCAAPLLAPRKVQHEPLVASEKEACRSSHLVPVPLVRHSRHCVVPD